MAGGVFRDLVVNEIPLIFRPGGLYAVAAFAGCWTFIGCVELELPPLISTTIAFSTIVGLRLISVYFGLELPKPHWWYDEK